MLKFLGIVLLAIVALLVAAGGGIYVYLSPEDDPPKIASPSSIRTISTGELIGFQGKHGAHTWLGIPYAQAPIDDLRWKAPRPAIPWEGRREALEYGEQCIQLPAIAGSDEGTGIVGDEDCLVLNIWAPTYGPTKVPTGSDRVPVMFWIHGGGNTIGSGGSDITQIYDGSLMATEHDVIVVTMNYRMGSLGWFSHDALMDTADTPEDASGNFGTLDLISALTWVQTNISQFGGDPARVTIFGESAGGFDVLSLMASPLAQGLFHGAIVQSGALDIYSMDEAQQIAKDERGNNRLSSREVIAQWLVNAGKAADRDAAIALQNEMSSRELSVWLRSLSPAEMYSIYDTGFAGMIQMPMLFADGYVLPLQDVSEIFGDPANYVNVPLMIGSNRDETKLFMGFTPDYAKYTGSMVTGVKDLAAYNRDAKYSTDMWRAAGVDGIADLVSQHQPDKVFAYRFDADDWRNLGFVDLKDLLGAAHALELPFVFGYFPAPAKILFPDSTFDEVELLSNSMMSYWAEFAYRGDPGQGRVLEEERWLPWRDGASSGHYLILDTEIDDGIRMVQEKLDADQIKADFLADTSHKSTEERCLSYRSAFFSRGFDQTEYESLGCQ